MAARGPADLSAWIERSKQTDMAFAARLGISRAYLSQILSGKRHPSLGLTGLIFEYTGIPPLAWLDIVVSEVVKKAG